jgi:hypothetical protein
VLMQIKSFLLRHSLTCGIFERRPQVVFPKNLLLWLCYFVKIVSPNPLRNFINPTLLKTECKASPSLSIFITRPDEPCGSVRGFRTVYGAAPCVGAVNRRQSSWPRTLTCPRSARRGQVQPLFARVQVRKTFKQACGGHSIRVFAESHRETVRASASLLRTCQPGCDSSSPSLCLLPSSKPIHIRE